ncbi:hypothetical protein FS837_008167 [Tulasnella sp. UAMH 9824]|nr:hypothetical protein FS837_008167 [Tulasnella sp. UAMH 9824]
MNPVPRPPVNLLGLHTKGYTTTSGGIPTQQQSYTGTSSHGHQRSASAGGIPYQQKPHQVVFTTQAPTTMSRPSLQHQPASFVAAPHASNRYAFVTAGAPGATSASPMVMVPTGAPQRYVTTAAPGVAVRSSAPVPAVHRIQADAGMRGSHGGSSYRPSRSASSDSAARHRSMPAPAPVVQTPYIPHRAVPPVDSDTSDAEDDTYTQSGYGAPIPGVPRILSATNTGTSNTAAPQPRPIMRKRTQSSASAVHFTPDNLFLTFPSAHTMKLANIPKFGSPSLMRALKEKVLTMWLPGIVYQKEGRGEYIVGFSGLEGAAHPQGRGYENGLTDADRKNWGIWTARGSEGVAALRLLTTLFSTFASQGFSYLASLHCLPPQLIFTSTPADVSSRFLAIEISVTPLQSKKQKVPVTDPDTGEFILEKKVKIDISHVRIRCVDFPDDVLRTVVGAVRNTGREGAGINTSVKKKGDEADIERDARASHLGNELLEFGVQGERWDMKGVYTLDSVICRGTGKRAVSRKELARSRAEKAAHPNMPQVIEADTDTLPVLLSHVLKSLSSNGFRLEASIPLPLPVPLVDPFSPFGHQAAHGGLSGFINGMFHDADEARRGHGREVWMFRNVGWFEDLRD